MLKRLLLDLPRTFYATAFYQELFALRKGVGLGFLFIATLVNVGQLFFALAPDVQRFTANADGLFQKLPEITVENGLMTMNASSPQSFLLFEGDKGESLTIVFDTQAQVSDHAALLKRMDDEKILFLASKNAFVVYDRDKKDLTINPYDTKQKVAFTHDRWIQFGRMFQSVFLPLFTVVLVGMIFTAHVITAFLGAILIMVVAPLFKVNAALPSAMRLASAAKIPVLVVTLLAKPYPPLQVLVWFGFAVFGLLSVKRSVEQT
jgi:hypothetical protein